MPYYTCSFFFFSINASGISHLSLFFSNIKTDEISCLWTFLNKCSKKMLVCLSHLLNFWFLAMCNVDCFIEKKKKYMYSYYLVNNYYSSRRKTGHFYNMKDNCVARKEIRVLLNKERLNFAHKRTKRTMIDVFLLYDFYVLALIIYCDKFIYYY